MCNSVKSVIFCQIVSFVKIFLLLQIGFYKDFVIAAFHTSTHVKLVVREHRYLHIIIYSISGIFWHASRSISIAEPAGTTL